MTLREWMEDHRLAAIPIFIALILCEAGIWYMFGVLIGSGTELLRYL